MKMRIPNLYVDDKKAQKLSLKGLLKGWENIEKVFYY